MNEGIGYIRAYK